jgi:hypothetical protein
MSYTCQQCEQTNTFKDVTNTVVKVALLGAALYVVYNFKDAIKEGVNAAVQRIPKRQSVDGIKKRKKK